MLTPLFVLVFNATWGLVSALTIELAGREYSKRIASTPGGA